MSSIKRRWNRTKPEDRDPRGKWYTGKPSLEERLFSKIKVNAETGCWEWQGAKGNNGYGIIKVGGRGGKIHNASRVSYELKNGPIPNGLHICHRCDNPPCINPDHLFAGTAAANMADMWAKGRGWSPCGESHHRAKLTEADVRAIRMIKGKTSREIGGMFGISHVQVLGIRSGKFWSHVTMEK